MKNLSFFAVAATVLLLSACGAEGVVSDQLLPSGEEGDTAAGQQVVKVDTLPHEVHKGTGKSWAYPPDTCFNALVLGSAPSFKAFWQDNGAFIENTKDGRMHASFNTSSGKESLIVYLAKDKKDHEVAYGMVMQKAGDPKAPKLPGKVGQVRKPHIITGHGINLGMSTDYVMNVYVDQSFTQWQTGDTLYLQYKPKEKDAEKYKRYSWKSYTVTYKFVDERLCRAEYFIDPKEVEGR